MQEKVGRLIKQVALMSRQLDDVSRSHKMHAHSGFESDRVAFRSLKTIQNRYEVDDGLRIRFKGLNAEYEIYRELGDNGDLRIDATSAGIGGIHIGDSVRPLNVYIYGTDEGLIGANNGTNNSYLLVEPTRAGFFTNSTNTFRLSLPNLSSTPATGAIGDLCVVSGKLYICTAATPTWTIVGTQT